MTQEELSEGNKLIAEFYKECIYTQIEGRKYLKCTGEKWEFPQSKEINKLYNNFPISDGNLGGGLINPDFTLLKFHSSWDWLMPVVEKIEMLGFRTIQHGFLQPYGEGVVMYDMYIKKQSKDFEKDGYIYEYEGKWNTSRIESVWLAVIEFIKWYNKQ